MSKKCKIKEPATLKVHSAYTSTSSHTDLYWDTERNKDPWRPASPKFGWHLDQITNKITSLLKEKNEAYGDTALNPTNIFSKLGSTEAICARIDDKLARISNKGITDETEDTVDDLIGYLLLLKMSMDREDKL
tara:strand:- start:963 stop:1361 length:399 start_codon:yes stop_codon:yes gene_type:complete